jgi:malate synthase
VLSPPALDLLAELHRRFEKRGRTCWRRGARARRDSMPAKPDFLPDTRAIREGDWRVAPIPAVLPIAASRSPARSTAR